MSKYDYDISKIIDAYSLSFSGLVMQIRMCACCLKIMSDSLPTSPVSLELLSVLCDWGRQGFCLFSFLPTRSSLTKHADKTSISAAHQVGRRESFTCEFSEYTTHLVSSRCTEGSAICSMWLSRSIVTCTLILSCFSAPDACSGRQPVESNKHYQLSVGFPHPL